MNCTMLELKGKFPLVKQILKKFKLNKDFVEDFKFLIVIDEGNTVLGYAMFKENKLYSIEVLKQYRNKGYGQYLMSILEETVFENYKELLIYHVLNIDFFKKLGYTKMDEDTMIKERF